MGLRILHHFRALTLGMLTTLVVALSSVFKTRAALQLENLALRHQLGVLHRAVKKPKVTPLDRLLWAWLSGVWADWRCALIVVKPETVIAWHRKGFRLFWTWKVRHGQPGRPSVLKDVRDLIRLMSRANPTWGAPRIHGELLKLGIDIGETSVSKYMVRHRKPPSQTWRTFLENHVKNLVSVDFFTVPTLLKREEVWRKDHYSRARHQRQYQNPTTVNPEHLQVAMDSGGAPEGIGQAERAAGCC